MERIGETESIAEKRESFIEGIGRQKSSIETAQPIARQAESFFGAAVSEFGGESAFNEGSNFRSNRETETFDESESANSRHIDSADTGFGFPQQTNFDDYFDSQRIEYGNQESEIQSLHQPGLFDAGGGSFDYSASIIAQSQIYQKELFESQFGNGQNISPDGTAETAGVRQGIEDFQINFENLNDVNIKLFDSSLSDQMMTVAMQCRQNDEELNIYVSASEESKDESLDINLEFRMEEPELLKREQEELKEDRIEELDMDAGFSLSM